MRKANQEITDPQIIEGILQTSAICRLAMLDGDSPYLLPFNYGYHSGAIYIHSAVEGKKLDILQQNASVCFEIEKKGELVKADKGCNWATVYRSIVGFGKVEILTEPTQKREGLEIIMAHNGGAEFVEFSEKHVDSVVILKLKIEELSAKQSSNWDGIHKQQLLELQTERLLLQEVNYTDLMDIHNLHSQAEVDEFNTLGIPRDIDETRALLHNILDAQTSTPRREYTWTIIRKDTNEFIGLAGCNLSNDKFRLGEIYYKLSKQQWGMGFATEVAKQLIATGFEHFRLHKVEAGVATGNVRSIKVLEKCGMTREGLRRKVLPIRGEWKDNYHYAILEGDLREL